MSLTAVKLRGQDLHMSCLLPEETTITMFFYTDRNIVPDEDCPRCGINLRETPDP